MFWRYLYIKVRLMAAKAAKCHNTLLWTKCGSPFKWNGFGYNDLIQLRIYNVNFHLSCCGRSLRAQFIEASYLKRSMTLAEWKPFSSVSFDLSLSLSLQHSHQLTAVQLSFCLTVETHFAFYNLLHGSFILFLFRLPSPSFLNAHFFLLPLCWWWFEEKPKTTSFLSHITIIMIIV